MDRWTYRAGRDVVGPATSALAERVADVGAWDTLGVVDVSDQIVVDAAA